MSGVLGPQLGVEIGWRGKRAAGQKRALQTSWARSMSPLASGSAGRHARTLAARVPRKAWHSVVNSERPPRQRPIARPRIPHQHPRHRTQAVDQPATTPRTGPARACWAAASPTTSANRRTPWSAPATAWRCALARRPPAPRYRETRNRTGRSRRPHTPCARPGSGGRYTGRSSATRAWSTRIGSGSRPIRSAITVAGIRGYPCNSSRIRGSTSSTIEPFSGRSYFGGSSEANAVLTVFFDIPNIWATALIGKPSARCSRRISAQSSTDNIPFWSSWLG